jgi:hypothetical protein
MIGVFAAYIGSVKLGLGKLHEETILTSKESVEMGIWTFALRSCHIVGMGLVRISVAMYLCIGLYIDRWERPFTFFGLTSLLRRPKLARD